MTPEETSLWWENLLPVSDPDGPQIHYRDAAINPSFPSFRVGEVLLGASAYSAHSSHPHNEILAFSTDASRIELGLETADADSRGADLRVEFIAVLEEEDGRGTALGGQVIAAVASMVATNPHQWSPQPGTLLPNVLEHIDGRIKAPHALLVVPWLWSEGVPHVHEKENNNLYTVPIQVVFISDAELDYVQKEGIDALQQHFSGANINIANIFRPCSLS